MSNAAEQAAGAVVETFARGMGRWLGYFGVAFGVATMVAAGGNSLSEWRVVGLGAALALVSWLVLVRPQASIREHGVFFRNMLRDAFIPASKIEACKTSQTLMVRAEAVTYHCPAVTRSARSMIRAKHGGTSMLVGLGSLGGGQPQEDYRYGDELRSTTTYEAYVESRVMKAASEAEPDDRQAVVSWAWRPVAGFVIAVLATVALFL